MAYFSFLYVRVSTTFCAPGVSWISNGLLSRKSLMLTGCGSFSFISASKSISLVSFALSSPSTPEAARRSREVEKAETCGRNILHWSRRRAVCLTEAGLATEERRATARGAERAILRAENMLCGVEDVLCGDGKQRPCEQTTGPKN